MVERMSKNINVLLCDDLLIYIFESLPNNQIFANELVCKNGREIIGQKNQKNLF